MNYDLDHGLDRHNTGSVKWDQIYTTFGSDDVLPMWIADMDFPVPKPVTEALIKRAQHEAYGYSFAAPSVLDAIMERLWRVYHWKVDPAWILFTPGVVPALHAAVRAFTTPGDEVVLQSPYTIRSGQLSVRMGARSPTTNCCGTAPGMSWISKG